MLGFYLPQQMEPTMAGVVFPPGISHVVSSLIDVAPPATPPGVPIPYPNIAHFENKPAVAVLHALFEPDIDVLGIAPHTDLFAG